MHLLFSLYSRFYLQISKSTTIKVTTTHSLHAVCILSRSPDMIYRSIWTIVAATPHTLVHTNAITKNRKKHAGRFVSIEKILSHIGNTPHNSEHFHLTSNGKKTAEYGFWCYIIPFHFDNSSFLFRWLLFAATQMIHLSMNNTLYRLKYVCIMIQLCANFWIFLSPYSIQVYIWRCETQSELLQTMLLMCKYAFVFDSICTNRTLSKLGEHT